MELSGRLKAPAALPSGKNPVSVEEEAGWTTEPVGTGEEKKSLSSPGL